MLQKVKDGSRFVLRYPEHIMHTIEVDFEGYEHLTVRRPTEDVTYDNVIRELLSLEQLSQA